MFIDCVNNQLKFRYVLMDGWFSGKENFALIRRKDKHFVAVLKDKRLFARSKDDREQGRYARVDSLELTDKQAVRGWRKGLSQEVLIVRRACKNEGGSTGEVSRLCSDQRCYGEKVADLHHKGWKIEAFYQSLQSSAELTI